MFGVFCLFVCLVGFLISLLLVPELRPVRTPTRQLIGQCGYWRVVLPRAVWQNSFLTGQPFPSPAFCRRGARWTQLSSLKLSGECLPPSLAAEKEVCLQRREPNIRLQSAPRFISVTQSRDNILANVPIPLCQKELPIRYGNNVVLPLKNTRNTHSLDPSIWVHKFFLLQGAEPPTRHSAGTICTFLIWDWIRSPQTYAKPVLVPSRPSADWAQQETQGAGHKTTPASVFPLLLWTKAFFSWEGKIFLCSEFYLQGNVDLISITFRVIFTHLYHKALFPQQPQRSKTLCTHVDGEWGSSAKRVAQPITGRWSWQPWICSFRPVKIIIWEWNVFCWFNQVRMQSLPRGQGGSAKSSGPWTLSDVMVTPIFSRANLIGACRAD